MEDYMKPKRIVTIQDISCVGKCSLTVALPIVSAMGVETAIIPTAVLSTHTMFKNFTFCDLTSEIDKITSHWKAEGIEFDGIYTGYLGSFEQLDLMKKLFADFGNGKLVLVDPCMADNGTLYPGFTKEFAIAMASLCSKADIITPNITEACFMLGEECPNPIDNYDENYIFGLLERLSALGAKKIILKGIAYKKNLCGVIGYDCQTKQRLEYFHELLPIKFHGTGDIFASVAFGALVIGKSLETAIQLAADFTVDSIKRTIAYTNHNNYGVDFESAIPSLILATSESSD